MKAYNDRTEARPAPPPNSLQAAAPPRTQGESQRTRCTRAQRPASFDPPSPIIPSLSYRILIVTHLQVFDANNNGKVDAGEWQRGLGDLGSQGEGAKR